MKKVYLIDHYSLSPLHTSGITTSKSFSKKLKLNEVLREITNFDVEHVGIKYAGHVEQKLFSAWPDRKVSKSLARKDHLSLESIYCLLEKYPGIMEVPSDRKGVFSSVSDNFLSEMKVYFRIFQDCADMDSGNFDVYEFGRRLTGEINPRNVTKFLHNNTVCNASRAIDAQGSNACYGDFGTSGAICLNRATNAIRDGEIDVAIVGCASDGIDPFRIFEDLSMKRLSRVGVQNLSCSSNMFGLLKSPVRFVTEGCSYWIMCSENYLQSLKMNDRFFSIEVLSSSTVILKSNGSISENKNDFCRLLQDVGIESDLSNIDYMITGIGGLNIFEDDEVHFFSEFLSEIDREEKLLYPKQVVGESYEASLLLSMATSFDYLKSISSSLSAPLKVAAISKNRFGKVCLNFFSLNF